MFEGERRGNTIFTPGLLADSFSSPPWFAPMNSVLKKNSSLARDFIQLLCLLLLTQKGNTYRKLQFFCARPLLPHLFWVPIYSKSLQRRKLYSGQVLSSSYTTLPHATKNWVPTHPRMEDQTGYKCPKQGKSVQSSILQMQPSGCFPAICTVCRWFSYAENHGCSNILNLTDISTKCISWRKYSSWSSEQKEKVWHSSSLRTVGCPEYPDEELQGTDKSTFKKTW